VVNDDARTFSGGALPVAIGELPVVGGSMDIENIAHQRCLRLNGFSVVLTFAQVACARGTPRRCIRRFTKDFKCPPRPDVANWQRASAIGTPARRSSHSTCTGGDAPNPAPTVNFSIRTIFQLARFSK
jgi:hypothetical protein